MSTEPAKPEPSAPATEAPSSTGKYVHPGLRGSASGSGDKYQYRREEFTLRISNLTENATERDVRELFRPYGNITHCVVKQTLYGDQYAYVSYDSEEAANKAAEKLDRHKYDHLVLSVELKDRKQ